MRRLFHVGPLIFAVGFLWPLFAQLALSLGLPNHLAWWGGAGLAGVFGGIAQVRGRWL